MGRFSPEEQETFRSLQRGIALVLIPGLIFVVGSIYLVTPSRSPIALANGCYQVPAGPLIEVNPPKMRIDDPGLADRTISIRRGKEGFQIDVDQGTIFTIGRNGKVHAEDGHWANTLLPVVLQSAKPPFVRIAANEATLAAPKVDCRLALSSRG